MRGTRAGYIFKVAQKFWYPIGRVLKYFVPHYKIAKKFHTPCLSHMDPLSNDFIMLRGAIFCFQVITLRAAKFHPLEFSDKIVAFARHTVVPSDKMCILHGIYIT